MVLLPLSPGTRFQENITVGPATIDPPSGVPRLGAAGFGPAGLIPTDRLNGPHPSPLHAATMTFAIPEGTGSVTVVAETTCAATVSAPPPGPAFGWIT